MPDHIAIPVDDPKQTCQIRGEMPDDDLENECGAPAKAYLTNFGGGIDGADEHLFVVYVCDSCMGKIESVRGQRLPRYYNA